MSKSDTSSIDSTTNSVTHLIANTHCIVCGIAFERARRGKLYCSSRCKQFGYNHRTEISQVLSEQERAINPKPLVFLIDDFNKYDKRQKMLKRYRELQKKKLQWESANQEILYRDKLNLPIGIYLWDSVSKKLTDDQENEFYNVETELEEELYDLVPKELSLEQWSFIKSLHPALDEIPFFELVCSLSTDFFRQLSLSESDAKTNGMNLVIKNKFMNHCNLIATGEIKFVKQEVADD